MDNVYTEEGAEPVSLIWSNNTKTNILANGKRLRAYFTSDTHEVILFDSNRGAHVFAVLAPAGTDKQVQFNDGGAMAGSGLLYDKVNSRLGVGITPTARLTLPAGTASSGTAPLKFSSGTLLSSSEPGALEFDLSRLYVTILNNSPERHSVAFTDDIPDVSKSINYNGNWKTVSPLSASMEWTKIITNPIDGYYRVSLILYKQTRADCCGIIPSIRGYTNDPIFQGLYFDLSTVDSLASSQSFLLYVTGDIDLKVDYYGSTGAYNIEAHVELIKAGAAI